MDDPIALVRRLHEHRAWVNQNLLAAAEALTDEQLHQAFSIGQGSVWKSLVHSYAAEYVWLEALMGDENPLAPGDVPGKLPGNQLAEDRIEGLEELRREWTRLESRWQAYLADLRPAALDALVYKVSASAFLGQRLGTSRADVLMHVCLHAHYTAAQIVNMLRQLGVATLPETMLITLARRERSGVES